MSGHPLNLYRFDFVSIRLAVLCAQTGNLTTAARECHLVLPAASRRIKDLEAAVGTALFERHSRGLKVTPAGQMFMRHGLTLLQNIQTLARELDDLQQGVKRHMRLFASTAAISQFLPGLLADLAQKHPDIQVDLEEKVSEQVIKGLLERRADVGVYVEGTPDGGLETQYFRGDELVLILPARHALTGKKPIAFSDTLDEHWISLNPGAALLQQQQTAAMALGKRLKLRMQVNSFDAVSHMVAAGLGVAMLPKASAMPIIQNMKVSWRPLQDAWAKRRLMIAIRPDADADVRAFCSALVLSSQNAKTG